MLNLVKHNKLAFFALCVGVTFFIVYLVVSMFIPAPVDDAPPPVLIQEGNIQPELQDQNQGATLTVLSEPSGARVIIDPPEEEVATETAVLAINTTPFKISNIRSGRHIIQSFLEGYVLSSEVIEVNPGISNTVTIKLIPVDERVGY